MTCYVTELGKSWDSRLLEVCHSSTLYHSLIVVWQFAELGNHITDKNICYHSQYCILLNITTTLSTCIWVCNTIHEFLMYKLTNAGHKQPVYRSTCHMFHLFKQSFQDIFFDYWTLESTRIHSLKLLDNVSRATNQRYTRDALQGNYSGNHSADVIESTHKLIIVSKVQPYSECVSGCGGKILKAN